MKTADRKPTRINIWEFEYETDLTDRIDDVFTAPHYQLWIDAAWVAMLIKCGLLPEEHIPKVAKTALRCCREPSPEFGVFGGIQHAVIEEHGISVGGSLTLGRTVPSQRQITRVRHELLRVMCLVYDFQEAILDMAGEHLTTMMPGYTHYRHAQPTTLGHYLLSVFDPIARIMERTEDAYHSMSLNELGCGALAGTSWDIDRDLVSSYLGLTGLIENTNDAVGFTDGYLNVAACMANLMAIVSRFTLDLNVWSSEEFGFLEVPWVGSDESTSQSEGGRGKAHSYFMPNKTSNSPFLERARVGAAQVLGAMTEVASMGVRVAHGDMHEMLHMEDGTVKAIEYTHLFLHPLLFTLPRIQVFAERMNEAVSGGYSCATELANAIMRKSGLDYRTAHEVVYDFVLESKRRGLGAENPDVEIFQEAARSVVGKQLDFTADELRLELDPHHFMEVTRSQGGISPQETRRMLDERRTDIGQAHQRHEDRIVYLESSRAKMLSDLESAARG